MRGICKKCGCTETTPCETEDGYPCAWTDETETLCNACVPDDEEEQGD